MVTNNFEYIEAAQAFHGNIPMVMGTRLDMLTVGVPEAVAKKSWDYLCVEAGHLDALLNRFVPDSELTKVNESNTGEAIKASPELAEIIRMAREYWERTDGFFDVSKGGMGEIILDEDNLLTLNGHTLDFGGFAKGFLMRKLREKFQELGIESAFVDFGGSSILTLGHHPFGDCWIVGVKDPFGGDVLGQEELKGESMSTSGNSPVYTSHIVNPKTGELNRDRVVVTAVIEDPLDAEILSTAALAAGEEHFSVLEKNFPGLKLHLYK